MVESRPFSIVFVAGVHGVGKTTFSTALARATGVEHVAASTLIKAARQQSDKRVKDVASNQDELVAALKSYSCHATVLLLDGHFCLIGAGDHLVDVPTATFEAIAPTALILLCADSEAIVSRCVKRDGRALPLDLIVRLQDREPKRATQLSKVLSVPLLALNEPFDQARAMALVGAIGG